MPTFFDRYFSWFMAGIVVFAIFTRFYHLGQPSTYMFDEVYHAVTAKLIANNDPRAYEWWNPPPELNTAVDWLHPPLAKYTQAASMRIFGQNSFGWRFSSAVFGVLVVLMVGILAKEITKSSKIALLAAFFTSLDGLVLVQSRIAMNDIHVTFAMLFSIWSYLRFRSSRELIDAVKPAQQKMQIAVTKRWLLLTAISVGITMGTKWSGFFIFALILGCEVSERVWQVLRALFAQSSTKAHSSWWRNFRKSLPVLPIPAWRVVLFFVLLPPVVYIASYSHMFMQGKSLVCLKNQVTPNKCYCSNKSSTWVKALSFVFPPGKETFMSWEARGGCTRLISHFSELHNQIWTYQTTLTATHPYQSRPFQWFLDLRPVWVHVNYEADGRISNVYAFGNPALFWIGDIGILLTLIASGQWLIGFGKATQQQSKKKLTLPEWQWSQMGILLLAYFIVWAPWQISPRIMFFYHYTPAVPLMSIVLAKQLVDSSLAKRLGQWATTIQLIVIAILLATFLVWYPHWTAQPVSADWANAVYFILPSWK